MFGVGGRLNGHEKKMGLKKIMGVKIQGNSLYFFPHQNRSKNKGIPFTFFCEIYPFCAKFYDKLFFFHFFHFFRTDILKHLLGGPKIIRVIYRVVFKKEKKDKVPTDPPTHPSVKN